MKTAKPTESPEVIEARQRAETFGSLVQETEARLQRFRYAHFKAQQELKQALVDADKDLPQATMREYDNFCPVKNLGKVVILRQTPTGHLVCRPVGSTGGCEMQFKICQHDNRFYSTEKQNYANTMKYLSDVPEKYIEVAREQNIRPFS
jgi:hypothetical protein